MQSKFIKSGEFLIIKLFGNTSPNERLIFRQSIVSHLQTLHPKVIVDLSDWRENGGVYLVGLLNTVRKETHFLGGEVKLCALSPQLYQYFRENRLLDVFETQKTLDQAKRSFKKGTDDGKR